MIASSCMDTQRQQATAIKISAMDLYKAFISNSDSARKLYTGKRIEVHGNVNMWINYQPAFIFDKKGEYHYTGICCKMSGNILINRKTKLRNDVKDNLTVSIDGIFDTWDGEMLILQDSRYVGPMERQ